MAEWIRILAIIMQVHSLGYKTDLIFPAFDGQITDRGDYLVIKTPSNPAFYWGNFLLFASPPGVGDFDKWREIFTEEIGKPPETIHQAMGWDTSQNEAGIIQPFIDQGFYLDRMVVLSAKRGDLVEQAPPNYTFRQLQADDDWAQSIENQVICREPIFGESAYRVFRQGQAKRYRAMAAAGYGAWFGAFAGDRLVGDLGIFCSTDLARYQSVQTHPDFRRQGIASALVHQAALYAFEHHNVETIVIVAEEDSPAQRLYLGAGFNFVEYQLGVWKADEK